MFHENNTFNQNIGGWDVANVTNMVAMFYYYSGGQFAGQFNQNLSGWCVTNIGSKPNDFDTNSGFAGQTALQPQWGTCP
ncbi:surface protein 26-residue repeat-containing protein [Synechococcus phage ACG-2014f]|nr:surface protein 26-residue repeat-containing protein [Synechococcus phage ACG-2014f]